MPRPFCLGPGRQGVKVGHVRKFDSRLRIEMLRAHMPTKFKAPGQANVKVNVDAHGCDVLVIGAEERDQLFAMRAKSLRRIQERKAPVAGLLTTDATT